MHSMLRPCIAAFAVVVASGCAQMAPNYSPSVEGIQKMRDSGASKVRVGTFEAKLVAGHKNDAIGLRASTMESPYGGKFTSYLEEALKSELQAAKLLDDKSTIEIGGVMTKNDVDISGFSQGSAEIEARVTVKKSGQVRFDKVKYTRTTFESSFAGAIAIPAGRNAYPELVRTFLAGLYGDPDFIAALK